MSADEFLNVDRRGRFERIDWAYWPDGFGDEKGHQLGVIDGWDHVKVWYYEGDRHVGVVKLGRDDAAALRDWLNGWVGEDDE